MTDTQPQDHTRPTGAPFVDGDKTHARTTGTSGFFDQVRAVGIQRSSDRWVAGVCGGLARRLGVDPLLIRAGFIALLLFGIGFLAYLIAWALLPDESGSIVAERAIRDGDGWGVTLLVVIGIVIFGTGPVFGGSSGWWSLVGLAAVVALIWWLMSQRRESSGSVSADPDTPGSPPAAGAAASFGASPPVQPERPEPVWAPAGSRPAGYEPPPTAGPAQGAPPRPAYAQTKAPRAGLAGFLLVLGAAIFGYGLGQVIGGQGAASTDLVALVGAAAAAGAATILLGLLGRRSTLSSLLSLGLAIALLSTWNVSSAPSGGGEQTWRPVADTQTTTYTWNAGQATLDLRGITERPDQRDISAAVALGELVIYVPEGITTRVVSNAWLGGVSVEGAEADTSSQTQAGPTVTTEHIFGGDATDADLTVNANVRLGSIRIVAPTDQP